jgi:hypothetical protein
MPHGTSKGWKRPVAVDPETYRRYLIAEKRARDNGLSLMEVLDRDGLLLTKKRRHNLEVQAVQLVSRRLDRQAANKLMAYYTSHISGPTSGRVEGTPSEMFEAVKLWLEIVCRNLADGTLEDL